MRGILVCFLCLGLAACGDPLAGLDRLSDVDVDQTDPVAAALPDAEEIQREGFFGTSAAEGTAEPEPGTVPETDAAVAEAVASAQSANDEAEPRRGFLRGLFGSRDRAAQTAEATPEATEAEEAVELAALAPEDAPAATEDSTDAPGGLLGLFGGGGRAADAPRDGPDARDVPFGTVLAFGEIARVCEAKGRNLGDKVEAVSRRGFTLYDSAPGLMSKRTYYLTGFSDGCPRQFTAANALLGTPSVYEQFRFGPTGRHMPYAATDTAYDKIKSRVCGARKGKPCGSKIAAMDKSTAFVSAYEFNEHNGRWKEFLVHDGAVVEGAVKSLN